MDNKPFQLSEHEPEARLARLRPSQAEALEMALARLSDPAGQSKPAVEKPGLPIFLLPLAELGLTADLMIRMAERVPAEMPFDHREIYFDFRLNRWIKHIEPPTVAECLEEYLENSESEEKGMAFLEGQWQAFLKRHRKV